MTWSGSNGWYTKRLLEDALASPSVLQQPLYVALYTDDPDGRDEGGTPHYWERGMRAVRDVNRGLASIPPPEEDEVERTPYTIDLSDMPPVGNGDTFTIQWNSNGIMNFHIDHVAIYDANATDAMCDHDTCWENLT